MKLYKLNEIYKEYTFEGGKTDKKKAGCIGIMTGRLNEEESGIKAFWETLDHERKTPFFMKDFDGIINALRVRKDKKPGILFNRHTLERFCNSKKESYQYCNGSVLYGFKVETQYFTYLFKIDPRKDKENLKVYCYSKAALENHINNRSVFYG